MICFSLNCTWIDRQTDRQMLNHSHTCHCTTCHMQFCYLAAVEKNGSGLGTRLQFCHHGTSLSFPHKVDWNHFSPVKKGVRTNPLLATRLHWRHLFTASSMWDFETKTNTDSVTKWQSCGQYICQEIILSVRTAWDNRWGGVRKWGHIWSKCAFFFPFVLFTWAKCVVSAINDASLSCSMFSFPGMEWDQK